MNRREALQQAAWLMGGALSAPALMGILNGCTAKPEANWQPVFLTSAQAALVGEVAEILIPRTDTPGAKDVGVPALIDRMLEAVYPKQDQGRFLAGLDEFDSQARAQHADDFLHLERNVRIEHVRAVTAAAMAAERVHGGPGPFARPFILMTRELTLLGYFTSQAAATKVLQYNPAPGPFRGCVPLNEAGNGRTWATEQVQRF
ncbi:MAG TPA: gluconate 2-dehydrogenase subunit 3 family protein [Povalibacter sp.]|uniref:gluconate 2-dehydrogenase subunit 3 family protein n=1 Tax=Povalibacter sp. TaxID=1962978 RepID=UPI002BFFEDB1|nr:gluconate 2-dehydrogenase subunit 3 family protein [Povalibacter sp.]HMN46022.1 gluconate 2-dehydrogenase subunit 3 family protein [Povalibacter sp.]